jgi:RNA polymerase sigma-70 factor (ECF subfamily)
MVAVMSERQSDRWLRSVPCDVAPPWYSAPVQRGRDTRGSSSSAGAVAATAAEDERWVRAAAGGDRAALGALYDRYSPTMLAVAQRVLSSAREAEDLVQDVFLEAWHRARYYEPARGTVRTWLMMRLRSRAIDRQRSLSRGRRLDQEVSVLSERDAEINDTRTPGDAGTVRGLLLELSAEHQAVLELGYFGGLSCAEIALRLNVPVGTVKSRMSRAIAQLRERVLEAERSQS